MTFFVHLASAVPFAADQPAVVESCQRPEDVTAMLTRAQMAYPSGNLSVVETLFDAGAAMPAVPPELDRAIDAWNDMVDRLTLRVSRVRAKANHVRAYRKWKAANKGREYLLEAVVAAVPNHPEMYEWIFFGWLLRVTPDGTLNSDKVLAQNGFKAKGRRPVEGADFEAESR